LNSFLERDYYRAGSHPAKPSFLSAPLHVLRERQAGQGFELIEGLIASAQPSGTTTRVAYETLRDELLDGLRSAMPVSMVVLGMHGAMVADGYDDCEGDILTRVREIVGPDVIVGAELDLHAHLSPTMVHKANLLVLYKEYPHTDTLARAHELVDLCLDMQAGKIQPVAALVDCQMIVPIHTTREPGKSIVQRLQALEGKDGILSVSIAHGFATGDVPDMGTKVLVYSDGDAAKAQALSRLLADELIAMREQLKIPFRSIDQALDEALAMPAGPIVLADRPDNPGSGAAGDSTFMLRRMLDRKIVDAALGPLWDPMAVKIAFDAGTGASLMMRLGGKTSILSGDPVDVLCQVLALKENMTMTGLSGGKTSLGNCALVRAEGIDIVLSSNRNQAMNIDLFTQLGCALDEKKIIVVKSAQHFYASFSTIAKAVIYVGGQGAATPDWDTFTYKKVQLPRWPLKASA
jgi:microcystin degradation protein MlrC